MSLFATPSLVVFDLDDTLYPYKPCNIAGEKALNSMGAKETGTTESEFKNALVTARKNVKSRLGQTASSHSRLLYIHEALALLNFSSQPSLPLLLEQEFWRSYLLEMKLRPGAEELLAALRFNHIPIALVTDLTLQIQLRKLVYLGLDSFFDFIVASEEVSGDKISKKPFRLLANRVPSNLLDNVWFIGDGIHDAPVADLKLENLIADGRGWIYRSANNTDSSSWSSLKDIEIALEESFEN